MNRTARLLALLSFEPEQIGESVKALDAPALSEAEMKRVKAVLAQ